MDKKNSFPLDSARGVKMYLLGEIKLSARRAKEFINLLTGQSRIL